MMLVLFLALAQVSQVAQEQACIPQNLVGTWRVVEVDGQPRPATYPVHKHMTLTHFALIEWDPAHDNRAVRVFAGPYAVKGDAYHESIVYGSGARYEQAPAARREAGVRYSSCTTSGDTWIIRGEIDGQSKAETWRRVTATP